jgi:SH3-like domain-containing protein
MICDLTGRIVPATAWTMRLRVVPCLTRLLLACALASTCVAGHQALAVAPPDPGVPPGVPMPPREAPPRHKHHAREAREPHGKAQPPIARIPVPRPDQKAHAPEPAAVPPAPKPLPAPAANEAPAKDTGEPPPKIPRFAALKTDETNMRKGPGQRYPIEWVYQRHDLPVEVEREYDVWRYVRDPDGVEGWVHQVTLSDRRTFVVRDKDAMLRSDAKDTASAVALLKVGVIGRLRECDEGSQWCQVQVGGYKGFLRRDQLWGLLPDEVLSPS